MKFCARGEPGDARVDDDELGTALHEVDDCVAEEPVRARIQRVLAPDYQVIRANPAGVVVAVLVVLRPVDFGHASAEQIVRDGCTRTVARLAGKRVGRGAVAGVEHRRTVYRCVQRGLAPGAGQREDALSAVLVPYLADLRLDEVICLIPGDLGPLVLATVRTVTHHRMLQTIFMIDNLVERNASRAQAPACHGMVGVAFHLNHLAVFHGNDQPTADWMIARRRPGTGADFQHTIFFDAKPLLIAHRFPSLSSACLPTQP